MSPAHPAGAYRDVLVRRWRNALGRTLWDFAGGRTTGNRYLVLGLRVGAGPPRLVRAARPRRPDRPCGPLLSDDGPWLLGTAALIEASEAETARAILTDDRYAGIEVHQRDFGGRPADQRGLLRPRAADPAPRPARSRCSRGARPRRACSSSVLPAMARSSSCRCSLIRRLGGLRGAVQVVDQQVQVAVGGVPEQLEHAAVGGAGGAVEDRGVEGVVRGGQGGRLALDLGVLVEGVLGQGEPLVGHRGHRADQQVALDQLAQPVDVGEVARRSARRPGRSGRGGG